MEDVRIAGVAFTGSTATAKRIARTLLADDERPIIRSSPRPAASTR
jgi:RHH-type proline utilization regulon transcriptional repressor/proline dehydrogenase/delta 1-pyrroline-5-carboxylate dehydrogenase